MADVAYWQWELRVRWPVGRPLTLGAVGAELLRAAMPEIERIQRSRLREIVAIFEEPVPTNTNPNVKGD